MVSPRNLVVLVGATLAVVVVGLAVVAAAERHGAPAASRAGAAASGATNARQTLTAQQIYQRYEPGVVEIVGAASSTRGSTSLVETGARAPGASALWSPGTASS